MHRANLVDHRRVLLGSCREQTVRVIDANHRTMRRNRNDAEAVDVVKLPRLCDGGARHPAHACVQRHEVFDRHRPKHPTLRPQANAFFTLQGCLQACRPASVRDDTALDFVHRQHGVVVHHVVHVSAEQHVCM